MDNGGKELSPISMITEQLANFHITENVVGAVRSVDVKKYLASILSFDPLESKDNFKVKSPSPSGKVFFGVNVPKVTSDDIGNSVAEGPLVFEKIEDALRVIKKQKQARFKSFTSREEAEKYSLESSEEGSVGGSGILSTEEEDGLPSVKSQDLVKLRKTIEEGNIDSFKEMVWDNARYLVNYHGDTPSILHEGFRYNALHVAARSKQPLMCQLILDTLSDPAFFDRLYRGDPEIRAEKISHLLDQYLNNPDKRLGETPLHFASKFGCLDTVKILLSHPYCIKDKKNKYGETPAQTICTRCNSATDSLRRNMEEAFKGLLYVPVLRAEDNAIPPCIEKPCTKLELERRLQSSKQSVDSPRLIVKAFAGPMSPEAAATFYRVWKNPSSTPKQQSYTTDEQKCIHKIRLTDTEKGLERAGRNIAQDLNAEWLEYWPALDAFINLASTDGLRMFEGHLNKFYQPFSSRIKATSEPIRDTLPSAVPPATASYINPLGHYLNTSLRNTLRTEEDDVFFTPPTSPENSPNMRRLEMFVNGSELSRTDIDMFVAIRDVDVDAQLYPFLSKWKKFIHSKLKSLERGEGRPKSLTPLATVRVPRLQRRCITPRSLFFKSGE